MEFFDSVKVMPIPFANALCILEEGKTCMVKLSRETSIPAKRVSAIQRFEGRPPGMPKFPPRRKVDRDSMVHGTVPPEFDEAWRQPMESKGEDSKFVEKANLVAWSHILNRPKTTWKQASWQAFVAMCDLVMKPKPKGATMEEDARPKKASLGAITSPRSPLVDSFKEKKEYSPQAMSSRELASQGRTRRFGHKGGTSNTEGKQPFVPRRQWLRKENMEQHMECARPKQRGRCQVEWGRMSRCDSSTPRATRFRRKTPESSRRSYTHLHKPRVGWKTLDPQLAP